MTSYTHDQAPNSVTAAARQRVAAAERELKAARGDLNEILESKLGEVVTVDLPTTEGDLRAIGYRSELSGDEYIVFQEGDPDGSRQRVHVHTRCLASDVFGGLSCGCGEHLRSARADIRRRGKGLIIYSDPHKGRNLGHLGDSPLAAPSGQERQIAAILRQRGVQTIDFSSNEPLDIVLLSAEGLDVSASFSSPATPQNAESNGSTAHNGVLGGVESVESWIRGAIAGRRGAVVSGGEMASTYPAWRQA